MSYLGTYPDIRLTLDREFPGKQAYTDDNCVVFAAEEDQRARAIINVRLAGFWEIVTYNEDGTADIDNVRTVAVPSARP
jgi:hypothetical protein